MAKNLCRPFYKIKYTQTDVHAMNFPTESKVTEAPIIPKTREDAQF